MHEIVIAAIALFGVVIVAASGHKFMLREDDRHEFVALDSAPALWSEETADAAISR